MKQRQTYTDIEGARVEYISFAPDGQLAETHAMLHATEIGATFEQQYQAIQHALEVLKQRLGGATVEMRRLFVSDATNQAPLIDDCDSKTSIIQQPPLDGSKVAVWAYLHQGRSNYTHMWNMTQIVPEGDSQHQATQLLERYEQQLEAQGATLADNCIRTWFFVRDVDTQYHGLVVGRRENFKEQGLTPQTHYLASTGIHGIPADTKAIIQMDTYAIKDIERRQQTYLYAPTHLNPTYQYGVTFERGVKIDFGDRSHIYISGTASINNRGEVEHIGDILKQTHRMWENVETLLAEGGARWDDVMQIIVYLRDTADYTLVSRLFAEKFPNTPHVITYAPVCRPTWLIEMECMAITPHTDSTLKPY